MIDSHFHLWDLSRHKHSWCPTVPTLNRSFLSDDYRHALAAGPIDRAIHIEAEPDEPFIGAETQWALSLAAEPNNPIVGVVGGCRPEHSEGEFRRFIEQFVDDSHFKGVRRLFQSAPDEVSQSDVFRRNVRWLGEQGLTFDLGVLSRQIPIATDLARACPDVQFILDHCGSPEWNISPLNDWRRDLREIASLPNVVCKISGITPHEPPLEWSLDDLRPILDHTIECFGYDRVLFGTDWPVCTLSSTMTRWVDAIDQYMQSATPHEREKLFVSNAQRIYRV